MKEDQQTTLLYISGYHASGKTTLGLYLAEKYQVPFIETGDLVRGEYRRRFPNNLEYSINDFVRDVDASDANFFANLLRDKVYNAMNPRTSNIVIINGMRVAKYIDQLKSIMETVKHTILWVESGSIDNLYERYIAREGIALSRDDFSKKLAADVELGLDSLRSVANIRITNDGNLKEFYDKGDNLMKQLRVSSNLPLILG